jgi:hypothetical protein
MLRKLLPFVVLVALVACGGSPAEVDTVAPPAAPEASEPAVEEAAAGLPPVVVSEEQLKMVVLDVSDLPPGFTVDDKLTGPMTYDSLVDELNPLYADYLASTGVFTAYRAAYTQPGTEAPTLVRNWAIAFADGQAASGYLPDHPTFYQGINFQAMPVRTFGEESSALAATFESRGVTYDAYHILVRQRNVVSILVVLAPTGAVGPEVVEAYGGAMEARLLAVVPGS